MGQWARAGVPLEVVLKGIEQAFLGSPPKRVRSLSYVVPAVESALEGWRTRRVGAAEENEGVDLERAFGSLLGEIEAIGRAQPDPNKKEVLRLTWREIDAIRGQWRIDESVDLIEAFAALSVRICEAGLDALDANSRVKLEADVDLALADERGSTPSVMAETRQAFMWRRVRRALGLPPLELDLGGGW